ncbi:hypothetical protein [Sphingorhabdus sp.]|jgi:hypothetical protein|uniref:hypothetical protein n=1 Tax=Sphingorhabdus sp. TaxID=1902408 RepID=UPI0037CA6499
MMRNVISILATMAVVFLSPTQAMAQYQSDTLISCQVGSKVVKIKHINNKYIYTYGKSGLPPEMSIESTGRDRKLFKYFGVYAGGNQLQHLRFVNLKTSYTIYISTDYGKDALLIVLNNGIETERKCISNIDYWDRDFNRPDILEDSEDNSAIR